MDSAIDRGGGGFGEHPERERGGSPAGNRSHQDAVRGVNSATLGRQKRGGGHGP